MTMEVELTHLAQLPAHLRHKNNSRHKGKKQEENKNNNNITRRRRNEGK